MDLSHISPYGLACEDKRKFLDTQLRELIDWHSAHCAPYARLLQRFLTPPSTADSTAPALEALPFLPVRLFKEMELLSVPRSEIVKTMTSSGTGGALSRIYLDKATAALQVKVLAKIMGDFIGPHRLPMLIIDSRSTVSDRLKFSARTAGILGFSMFGREVEFALDDDMQLNEARVRRFLDKYPEGPILLFGFTFMVWQHLVLALEQSARQLPLERGVLIHGGGWKQMLAQAVDPSEFKTRLAAATGVGRVHNYYGMVEQTGSIFMECEAGHLHASSFSEVLIRDSVDFSPLGPGEPGLVEVLSVIPRSYPGHILLSEDLGEWRGQDDCPCGRMGRYFLVHGRIQQAEIRGCSDTYTR
jgi:hypothetical protein